MVSQAFKNYKTSPCSILKSLTILMGEKEENLGKEKQQRWDPFSDG